MESKRVIKHEIIRLLLIKKIKSVIFTDGKEVKNKINGIKYMKAWGAKFKYHGFNVDMNNKTPFECIPNALFKMYGNRDAGRSKFISPVCKGGIEFFETILNSYHWIEESNLDG